MIKNLLHLLIGIIPLIVILIFNPLNLELKVMGIAFLMVYWWISQPIPLYLTALIPLIAGIPLGLIDDTGLAQAYGNKMVFLFLGGFIIALGIEKWKLHEFFAEHIINLFGNTPARLLAGFMLATAILSMWISNTATALMMLPMALSIIKIIPRFRLKKRFAIALLLGVAFAANIGGTATLIGTPPNVQMAAILEQNFGITITFTNWLFIGIPFMVVMLISCFFVLKWAFLRKIRFTVPQIQTKRINTIQKRVLLIFSLIVVLWITRDYLSKGLNFPINDTMIALLGGFLFFVTPSDGQNALLKWEDMKRIPWGILFLFGGGLALATMLSNAGAIELFVNALSDFSTSSLLLVLLIVFIITIFGTELMSNLALVSLLIPLMGEFAIVADLPIVGICAGIALSASCAFMLPVATPPNAIVFSANIIQVKTMARVGVVLNLVTVLWVTTIIYIYNSF